MVKKYTHEYYLAHRERFKKHSLKYEQSHRAEIREKKAQIKREVMFHYSNGSMACANLYSEHITPYTTSEVLTLDLIAGGHYKSKWPVGDHLYRLLKNEGYPKGWQVLCMNCQWIKRIRNSELGNQYS